MKKSLVTGLAILTLLPQVVAAAAVNMTYNGSPIYADVPPIIRNDRTFVPLRFLSETLGYKVGWDNATRTATVSGKSEIRLTIGKTTALVNGEEKSLDVAPFIEKERTMVPIRFVAENMEGNIEWDEQTKTVKMTGPELPKAQPVTIVIEGQEVLTLENPKMVGNVPMIPVGQVVRKIDPHYIFRYYYEEDETKVFSDLISFDYYPETKEKPENFDISIGGPAIGSQFTFYPKYGIFAFWDVVPPVVRPKIAPIVEGKEFYVDADFFAYLNGYLIKRDKNRIIYRENTVDEEVSKDSVAAYWDGGRGDGSENYYKMDRRQYIEAAREKLR